MTITQQTSSDFRAEANVLRGLAIDAVETAGHGHPGAAMGMADIATVLYANHLKQDSDDHTWFDRDRVVLSNGHASILLYSLLYLTGVKGVELADLKAFRKASSKTPGHPEFGHTPGVETTTGPLGQGLATAVGMAMAEARMRDEFGKALCNHRTWVFAGDGCLMEGVGQEAVSLAGHLQLGHLNLLYDMNTITIDGSTELSFTEDTAAKFRALGWHVLEADGHSAVEIDGALAAVKQETTRPSIILFRTTIGFGAPTKAGTSKVHGAALGADEAAAAKAALVLPATAFDVDSELVAEWRAFGRRGADDRAEWQQRLDALPMDQQAEFTRRVSGILPTSVGKMCADALAEWIAAPQNVATRKASQMALEVLTEAMPELIGGSADLSGSNLTKTVALAEAFGRGTTGRYVNYGVREFAMAAAMNGISLHGGLVPYGGTFLVFSDYMRNAIRLSALMGIRVVYVMTHDSIGLGEDGPTHQPVEHLASLRAIPGLNVFRPADLIETMEAYQLAFDPQSGPSLLALSRQGTPQIRLKPSTENQTAKGGYVIHGDPQTRELTLIATGTEVAIAIQAAQKLAKTGVAACVVSLPCWELFDAQSAAYRAEVLGTAPRIAIEAASPFGWSKYVGDENNVIGVPGFGASSSAEELYEQFGITPLAIAEFASNLLVSA